MIQLKSSEEIVRMQRGGQMLAEALSLVAQAIEAGITLQNLDAIADREIRERGGIPSFKGYRQRPDDMPFPSTLCASVNSEVVHGPASREVKLKEGDIIGLDLGLLYEGLYTDMAVTVPVGRISDRATELIATAQNALANGIAAARLNVSLGAVSRAIYKTITKKHFGVVTGFCGHGVGKNVHEEPMIPNYPTPQAEKIILQEGMTLALEPMVTAGKPEVVVDGDGWTARTADGGLAAHFEHTIAITKNGAEILTAL